MQFYLFNICPRLHRCKWWKLCVTLFRIFSSSPAACWGCCSSNLNSETLLFTAKRCNLHIHTDFWSKFCLLYWMAPCWQAVWRIIFKIRVTFGVRFERRKVDKKQTYTNTETCKLYSRVFWIFLPNVIKIDPYNFELYSFKVCAFFLRHSVLPRAILTATRAGARRW